MTRNQLQILSLTRKQRYGISVLVVIFAALLRATLGPIVGTDLSLFFFIIPVMVAAWYGGLGPGLLATFLSILVGDVERVAGFAFTGALFSILSERTRNALKSQLECQECFGILVDSVPDYAVFATDPQGRIKSWNTGAQRITGFREGEIIGHPLSILYAPEDAVRDKLLNDLKVAAAEGRCEHEGWQTHKDGSRFWASIVIASLRNQAGQLSGFAQVIRDMTERKVAGEASKRFLQDLIDVSPGIIYIFDIERRKHVFVNRSAAAAWGYDLRQVEAADFVSSVMHPDHWKLFLEYLRRLASLHGEETADFEYQMRGNDGTWRWFHSRHKVFARNADGSVREIIGAATDITDRKCAEKRLKDSDDRYRAFIANSMEGIWRYELDQPIPVTLPEDEQIHLIYQRGYIAECNDVFARAHGYSGVDQIRGWRLVDLFVKSDPETVLAHSRAFIRSGYRLIGAESRELDIHGNTGYFLTNLIGVQENGMLVRGWGTQREITEQKRAEKEREELLLKEEAARREAEGANRLKDEFLATISHELRTPLTVILGWARMLTGGVLSEAQGRHAFEVIQHSAELQSGLVDDILDTSRIIAGRFNVATSLIEVGTILQAAVDVIRPTAEAKRITLQVVSDQQSSTILGDASRVHQIFWNLLSNAVKFTNEGGHIEARLTRSGDRIEISITDTGVGIEPKFLPYVFDRFRQADSTSTRKYGGLGLGLAIVRHLAEVHGGGIVASSSGIGMGSTFKVHFPAAQITRAPQPEGGLPEPESKPLVEGRSTDGGGNLNGVHVLVVDDDPETLDLLKFILEQSQAKVTAVASAAEALRALEQSPADVLVSDLAMPNQDGYDLIRQVRSRAPEHGGNIPAVALSAYTRAEDRESALAAGFYLYLSKPVDPSELVAAVARMVGRQDRNAA